MKKEVIVAAIEGFAAEIEDKIIENASSFSEDSYNYILKLIRKTLIDRIEIIRGNS